MEMISILKDEYDRMNNEYDRMSNENERLKAKAKSCKMWREGALELGEENFMLRKVICGVSDEKIKKFKEVE